MSVPITHLRGSNFILTSDREFSWIPEPPTTSTATFLCNCFSGMTVAETIRLTGWCEEARGHYRAVVAGRRHADHHLARLVRQ